jgi:hypothetical protein
MEEKSNLGSLLVGKPEGNILLGRPRRMRINNIKVDLVEKGLVLVELDRLGSG